MKNEKKKKGILATIWESMTKTGGCNCGPGESCYGDLNEDHKKDDEQKGVKNSCN